MDEIYLRLLENGTYRKSYLLLDYPEHARRIYYIVQRLLSRYKGVGIVIIKSISTGKTRVINPKHRGEYILYLKGREQAIAYHILTMLESLSVHPRSLITVLRSNRVPEAAVEEIRRVLRVLRKAIRRSSLDGVYDV